MAAARATATVLLLNGGGEVDLSHVRNGCEPRQHVGEFLFEIVAVVVGAEGCCEFANFLHQPHERPRDTALGVFFVVHGMDQGLEVAQGRFGVGGGSHVFWVVFQERVRSFGWACPPA